MDRGQAYGQQCIGSQDLHDTDLKLCLPSSPNNRSSDELMEDALSPLGKRKPHVVLVGDSHAVHWLPVFRAAADRKKWPVTGVTKSSCIPANVTVELRTRSSARRANTECLEWVQKVVACVLTARPDVVIFSSSPAYNLPGLEVTASQDLLADGIVQVARIMHDAGIRVLAIKHTPVFNKSPLTCISSARKRNLNITDTLAACTSTAADLGGWQGPLTLAAKKFTGLRLLSFDDAFVNDQGEYPPIIGNERCGLQRFKSPDSILCQDAGAGA